MKFEKGSILCRRASDLMILNITSIAHAKTPRTWQKSIRVELGIIEESNDFFEEGNQFSGILGLAYSSIAFVCPMVAKVSSPSRSPADERSNVDVLGYNHKRFEY